MARFDVFENTDGDGWLLDVQSDLLSEMNTRVVVPLLPINSAPKPAKRLNPTFLLEKKKVVMSTQFLAAIPVSELKNQVTSLSEHSDEIRNALEMLFIGF